MPQDPVSSGGAPRPPQKKPSAFRQPSAKGKLTPKPGQKLPHPQKPPRSSKPSEGGKLELKRPKKPTPMTRDEADRTIGQTLRKPSPKAPPPEKPKKTGRKEKPLGPPKEPISKEKRRMRQLLLAAGMIVVLLSICVVLSLTVFFKIEVLEVEGTTRYDHQAIISQAMVGPGDNLLLSNTAPGEEIIPTKFPYIETVTISKRLPNRIVISVQEAEPASILESNRKYVVLSAKGKVLEICDQVKYDVPLVMGARLNEPTEGEEVSYGDETLKAYLDKLISELAKQGLKDVTTVDLNNTQNIRLVCKNGFTILLGSFEEIEYKIHTAVGIMEQELKAGEIGTLDVSLAKAEGGRSYWKVSEAPKESSVAPKPKESSVSKKPSETTEPEESESPGETTEPEEAESPEEPVEWDEPEEGEEDTDEPGEWEWTPDEETPSEGEGEEEPIPEEPEEESEEDDWTQEDPEEEEWEPVPEEGEE